MSIQSYSLKWEILKSAATITVTASRVTLDTTVCDGCGAVHANNEILSYSASKEFDEYIATCGGTPKLNAEHQSYLVDESIRLLCALAYGAGVNPSLALRGISSLFSDWYSWQRKEAGTDDCLWLSTLVTDAVRSSCSKETQES